MRFDRLGIIELIEEARACSARSIFLRPDSKPLFRMGTVLVTSRFSTMTHDDAVRIEKMLARESGVLDTETNRVRQDEFVCSLSEAGRVRVGLLRGQRGLAIELNLISAEMPDLESIGLPLDGGLARRGGSINLVGGYKSKQVGMALIGEYCDSQASTVVTIEGGIEYDLEKADSWIVQQCSLGDQAALTRALASLNGGNVDLLFVEGLSRDSDALALIELAEQGVDIIVSMKSGAIGALESAFMTVVGDSVMDGQARFAALMGNKYTLGRAKIESNLRQLPQNVSLLSMSNVS